MRKFCIINYYLKQNLYKYVNNDINQIKESTIIDFSV